MDKELQKIADESTLIYLINTIDSIGFNIENEIKDEFDLRDLIVLKIGVARSIKEYLVETETNVERVKAITSDEIINYVGTTKFKLQENSASANLSLALRTKYDSEVLIEYVIYYHEQQGSSNPKDSLSQDIKNTIVDSLSQYEMYEMWATERSSMEIIIERIIKISYPKTNRVIIFDVVIPEETEKQFLETDKSRKEIIEELDVIHKRVKFLRQKLESDKSLSKSETAKIKKEIENLENDWKSVQKKGKLLTYDYKL